MTPYAEGGGGSALNQYNNTKESFFSANKTGESFHRTKSTIRHKKNDGGLGGFG